MGRCTNKYFHIMPYSKKAGKAPIVDWIDILKSENKLVHNATLDIGVGSGTYVNWLKHRYDGKGDYLSNQGPLAQSKWTGVEVWKPYLSEFDLDSKYDSIINEDIRQVDYAKIGPFDVAIAGDVLEHMSKEDAITVVDKVLDVSTYLFISIPIIHYPQAEEHGNPFEAHVKDDWDHEEMMQTFPDIVDHVVGRRVGAYMLTKNRV